MMAASFVGQPRRAIIRAADTLAPNVIRRASVKAIGRCLASYGLLILAVLLAGCGSAAGLLLGGKNSGRNNES